jgi:hypothetical protein
MAYPAPKRRNWLVQVEFLDGTILDGMDDDEIMERWRRVASWSDPTAETDPTDWMGRILARARTFYVAHLYGINERSSSTEILEAMDAEKCLSLRRK